jgi:Uma2 family endonuclease
MSAIALEKTNIPQRDSPPPKTWTRYEFKDEPKFDPKPKSPKPKETLFTKAQNELPSSDGIPMDSERHRKQMEILINSLEPWLGERGYVGGNMFVYYSPNQVKNEDFKGPDVFVALGCSNHERDSWIVWEEGKAPDVAIELLSKTTAKFDKEKKKLIYQNQLGVQEYYWFNPKNPNDFQGFELTKSVKNIKGVYKKLPFQTDGFISQTLGLKLIRWHGVYKETKIVWLRWATLSGELLLLPEEIEAKRALQEKQRAQAEAKRAEQEKQRAQAEAKRAVQEKQHAQAEAQRANAAEQRAERLAQLLREQGIDPDKLS